MKKKQSPRLIALAMALVMLLPMMTGTPAFAAEVMAQIRFRCIHASQGVYPLR